VKKKKTISLDEQVPDLKGTGFESQKEVLKWSLVFTGYPVHILDRCRTAVGGRAVIVIKRSLTFCDAHLKGPFVLDLSYSHFLSKSTPVLHCHLHFTVLVAPPKGLDVPVVRTRRI